MLIACAVLLMLPATIGLIANLAKTSVIGDALATIQDTFPIFIDIPIITKAGIKDFSKGLISLTALLVLFLPKANILIPNSSNRICLCQRLYSTWYSKTTFTRQS